MRSKTYRRLAAATFMVAALASAGGVTAADGAIRPDDRPTHGPGAVATAQLDVVLRPDDRADRRLRGATVAIVRPTTAGGFDWADAGIGAIATLGVLAVAAGASVMTLRHRAQTA